MSQQQFAGTVDQVAAGDIHNYAAPGGGRALTKGERAALNRMVRQLEDEGGEPGWKTWKFLHRTIGVDGIDAMRIEHRDIAEELLGLQLRCAQLQSIEDAHQPVANDETDLVAEKDKLGTDLKRARQMLARMIRQAEHEKLRAEAAIGERDRACNEMERTAKLMSRAYDELAAAKAEIAKLGKGLRRQRFVSVFLALLAASTLVWARM